MKQTLPFCLSAILCLSIAFSTADSRASDKPVATDGQNNAGALENLARSATASAGRRSNAQLAIDGIKNIDGEGEWVSDSPSKWYGAIRYPAISLTWENPVMVNKVVIYDRPCLDNHLAGAILKFSDGSEVSVTAIPNDGTPKTVVFTPREITSMRLNVVDGLGDKIGLSEIEVYHDPEAVPAVDKRTFTDLVSYVDPTIETGRGRWFFCAPGSLPFGMASASAYTRNKNQGGGGYNYNSLEIRGFTQQKCWIMGALNLMPVTGDINPIEGDAGWLSPYSHDTEIIEPGYHQVFLDRYRTKVEYTATERVVYYRFTYKEAAEAKLLLQLGGYVGNAAFVDGHANMVSPTRIEGSHGMTTRLWGGPRLSHAYFVIESDRPIKRMDGWKGPEERLSNIDSFANPVTDERLKGDRKDYLFKHRPEEQAGVSLAYDVAPDDVVNIRISISFTNIENARNNMVVDGSEHDFDKVRAAARATWNEWLGRITVKGGNWEARVKFYTDLWHVLLGRHKIDDASGDYPSFMPSRSPFQVRTVAKDEAGKPLHHMYNSDSLWLTMWNQNILWGLGWPDVMDNFSASWVQYARDGGTLPRGPSAGGYTGIMRGSPGTSLLASTYQKGLMRKADPKEAVEFMEISNKRLSRFHRPDNASQAGVEYWATAQMALDLGMDEKAASYEEQINSWKKFYNPEVGFLLSPNYSNPLGMMGWMETNAWQGTFTVTHDIPGLVELMGGNDVAAEKLNYAFERGAPGNFTAGYGGGYVNYSNQPGLSAAHTFSHFAKPWLTQYWVRRVSKQTYGGICANTGYGGLDEDQGQLAGVSALMKIGLFCIRGNAERKPRYEITTPEFDEITIQLDPRYYPGKEFTIRTHNQAPENVYIQKATFNGKPHHTFYIWHDDFAKGGTLELWLGPEPNKSWGVAAE